jgi:hypothetical protein
MSRADIPIEEARRSQPESVKDICKLQDSDATSPPSIAKCPLAAGKTDRSRIISPVVVVVVVVGIVHIASYMRRIMNRRE